MNTKIINKKFIIKHSDGVKFAKESGDFNPIHIDKKYGYNSIYGENITHGILLIILFFKKIVIQEKTEIYRINIKFIKPATYNNYISIKKNSNALTTSFYLIQDNNNIVEIDFQTQPVEKKNKNLLNKNLIKTLKKISWYTGMKYPGKNSLLYNFLIEKKKDNFSKVFTISSRLLDKRLPIIKNSAKFKNYNIFFTSLYRPFVKIKKIHPKKNIIQSIKKINENVLIIGASQGIGKDILNLLSYNKKISIVATYFKNKFTIKNKNVIIKKVNIDLNQKIINRIIEKYSPLKIFYFATKKILFERQISKKKVEEYKYYFLDFPLNLLKKNKDKKISFFYPSTEYINFDSKAPYSKIKAEAEDKIKKFCVRNNIKFIFHRFPAINSRQSVTILNSNNPSLNEYFNVNKKVVQKILLSN